MCRKVTLSGNLSIAARRRCGVLLVKRTVDCTMGECGACCAPNARRRVVAHWESAATPPWGAAEDAGSNPAHPTTPEPDVPAAFGARA